MIEPKSNEEERTEKRANKKEFFQNRVQDLGGIGLSFLGMGGIEEKAGSINKGLQNVSGNLFDKMFREKVPVEETAIQENKSTIGTVPDTSGTTEFQDRNLAQKTEKNREDKEDSFQTEQLQLLSALKTQGEDREEQEEDKEKQLALENEKITKKAESKQNKKDFFKNRAQDAVGIGLSFLGLGGLEEKATVIGKGVDKASDKIFTKIFGPIPEAIEEAGENTSESLNNVDETVETLDDPTKKTEAEQYQEVIEKQRVRKETERDIREGKFEKDQLGVLTNLEEYQLSTLKWQDELLDKQDELILGQRKIVKALDGDGPLDDLFGKKKGSKRGKSRKGGKGSKGIFKGITSKVGGVAAGAGSFLTGGLGLSGMLGSSMTGIAGAGAGALAGSAALTLGAGAAGYGAGTLLNKGVSALTGSESWGTDWMMDKPLPDPELKGEDFKNPEKLQSAIKTLQEQVKEKESEFWTSGEDEIAMRSKKQQITMYQTLLTKISEKERVKEEADQVREPAIVEAEESPLSTIVPMALPTNVVLPKATRMPELVDYKDIDSKKAEVTKLEDRIAQTETQIKESGETESLSSTLKDQKVELARAQEDVAKLVEAHPTPVVLERIVLKSPVTGRPTIAAEELRTLPKLAGEQRIPIVSPPAREAPQRIPMPLPSEVKMDRSTVIDDLGLIYLNSVLFG